MEVMPVFAKHQIEFAFFNMQVKADVIADIFIFCGAGQLRQLLYLPQLLVQGFLKLIKIFCAIHNPPVVLVSVLYMDSPGMIFNGPDIIPV